MSLDAILAVSRSSAWASVLTSLTGESWSDSVIGLNDPLPITVLELCVLERFGARSKGWSSPLKGE